MRHILTEETGRMNPAEHIQLIIPANSSECSNKYESPNANPIKKSGQTN